MATQKVMATYYVTEINMNLNSQGAKMKAKREVKKIAKHKKRGKM